VKEIKMDDELPIVNESDFDYRQDELFKLAPTDSKRCKTCKVEKGISEFAVNVRNRFGEQTKYYSPHCRGCRCRYHRERGRKQETKIHRLRRRDLEKALQHKRDREPLHRMKVFIERHAGRGRVTWATKQFGYSPKELVEHLERLWEPNMSWENYGLRDGWEIDHVIPRCKFDLNNPEQFKRCHALSNLRPLWRRLNVERLRKA
jgi:hypothetical protein